MLTERGRRVSAIVAVGVGALALVLRTIGIGYGLPDIFNPDEVAIMSRAMAFGQGDLNPHNFLYPTLYFYVLFAWEGAWFVIGRLTGVFASLADFERAFFVDPSLIYLAGRTLSAICGVLTVFATWRLGSRLFGPTAGFIAALLVAVAPLAVMDAHYVKHDVPVTLLIVLAVLAASHAFEGSHDRRSPGALSRSPRALSPGGTSIVAGALAGLAMSTHYYAIFVALPLALAAMLAPADGAPMGRRVLNIAIAGFVCAVVFFAASPFLLVEPGTALRDIAANREIVVDRVTANTGMFGSLGAYTRWLTNDAMGTLAFLLAVGGIAVAFAADWRRATVLVSFPAAFLIFISNTFPASRYLNPVLPFLAVLAGAGGAWLREEAPVRFRRVATILVILATIQGATGSLRADLFFRQTDTRAQAKAWITANLPEGSSLLIQPYSVVLRPSRDALSEAFRVNLRPGTQPSIKFRRQLALDPYPSPAYRIFYLGTGGLDVDKMYVAPSAFTESDGLDPLRDLGITYVVLKRFEMPDPALAALEASLTRGARPLIAFSPYDNGLDPARASAIRPFVHGSDARIVNGLERPGPTITIWRIE